MKTKQQNNKTSYNLTLTFNISSMIKYNIAGTVSTINPIGSIKNGFNRGSTVNFENDFLLQFTIDSCDLQ